MAYRPGETRTCRKCGTKSNAALPFCARCGRPLSAGGAFYAVDSVAAGSGTNPRWLVEMAGDIGLWLIVPAFALGTAILCTGLGAHFNGDFTEEMLLATGVGAFIVWGTQRAIRRTAQAHRKPKVEPARPIPDADHDGNFGEEGNEIWRIPGYGTDAEERAEDADDANNPRSDEGPSR